MVLTSTIVLWDCNGKIEATLFASRREAFKLEPIMDQIGMIAVKVSSTESFDEANDYLLRQVSKNGRIENQPVFGATPKWAGGTLLAGRCVIADGGKTTRLLRKYPPSTYADCETLRLNGINTDEDCCGK